MADSSEMIRVTGLVELQRALKAIHLEKDLKAANLSVAQLVAEKAQAAAEALGGVAAHVAPDIKAAAEQRRAKVTLGRNDDNPALGAEFGGQARPTTQQFSPYTGHTGRFLYPTVRSTQEQQIETWNRAIEHVLKPAFPD